MKKYIISVVLAVGHLTSGLAVAHEIGGSKEMKMEKKQEKTQKNTSKALNTKL